MYYITMYSSSFSITIHEMATVHCPPAWRWDSQGQTWQGMLHLWVVVSGAGTLRVAGEHHGLSPGGCFVLRTSERHYAEHASAEPLVVRAATFDLRDPDGACHLPSFRALPRFRRMAHFFFFDELLLRAIACWQNGGHVEGAEDLLQAWWRAILSEIHRQDEQDLASGAECRQREKVRAVHSRIRRSPGEGWSLTTIAEAMHCSPNHAIRLFKRFTGMTPGQAVIHARLETARSLLCYSDRSIGAIADELGYCDPFAFSKQFRRFTGFSPNQYRHRKTAPPPS